MLRMRVVRTALAAACLAALVVAVPAAGKTYRVSGKQIAVDEDAGIYKMRGGLIGDWRITSFEEVATSPVFHGRGTEKFSGCLDRRRDRSCKGDPSGTLELTIDYWALFASPDPASLVWGACFHPIVSGTGDFANAQGVVQMVDTPTRTGIRTDYIGTLTVKGGKARATRASHPNCGDSR